MDQGVEVWLVRDSPRFDFDPPKRLYSAARFGRDASTIGRPYAEYVELVTPMDRLFKDLEVEGARIVDLPTVLCDDGFCPVLNGNTPLYRDYHHLSIAGSLATAPAFESLFESLATR